MKGIFTFLLLISFFLPELLFSQSNTFINSRRNNIMGLLKQPQSFGRDTSIIRFELDLASDYTSKKLDSSYYFINTVYKKLKTMKWPAGWGYFYRTRGYYYTFAAKKDSAVSDYIQAIRVWEQLQRMREVGIASARLGAMLASDYQFDKGFYYLNYSLRIFESTKDYFSQGNVHNYLADAYRMKQDYPKALEHYRKTIALSEKYKLPSAVVPLTGIGTMFLFNNLPDSATIYYKKAGIDPINNPASITDGYLANRLAEFYTDKKEHQKTIIYGKIALDIAQKRKSDLYIKKAHDLLYKAYEAVKNYESALKHFQIAIFLVDSLQGVESSKRLNELELQYQTQKKEAEIARQKELLTINRLTILKNSSRMQLLNKDLELNQQRLAAEEAEQKLKETEFKNISAQQQGSIQKLTLENQLKQQQQLRTWLIVGSALLALLLGFIIWNNRQLRFQNIALQAALLEGQTTERKRVAADLHDALGSTLSSLRWSIGAIDKNKLEPKQQEVYQHVQSTIEQAYDQVRLLSHNLLPEELEKQGLWKALEMLIKKLNRNTPVTFSLQLPDNPAQLNSKTEFELYSICLELINNILKHAHATEASISFTQLNGQFKLTVSDNGKGITKHTPKGKGQHNIDERVQTLGGQRYIISNENGLTNEVVFSA